MRSIIKYRRHEEQVNSPNHSSGREGAQAIIYGDNDKVHRACVSEPYHFYSLIALDALLATLTAGELLAWGQNHIPYDHRAVNALSS